MQPPIQPQPSAQAALAPRRGIHPNPKVIAVASGKGGVGKTWFSITLSHWFAKLGHRTLLFDSDLGLANVDIQLGLMPEKDLGSVLAKGGRVSEAITRYQEGAFDVIAGRSGSGALASMPASRLADVRTQLMGLTSAYDKIVIDLGAGIERNIRAMAKEAETTLVITNDEPTSLTDAYTYIKVSVADDPNIDIRLVVNLAHAPADGEKTYGTILKASKGFLKYEPPLAGIIRRDKRVPESIRTQTPILLRFPNSPAADDVEAIAKKLSGRL